MGKKGALASIFSRLLVADADSPPSPASKAPSPPWPWLSSPCRNPQTSSSRDHRRAVTRSPAGAAAVDDDMYKTANSAYQLDEDDFPCFSPDDGGSCFDVDEDEELVEDHDGGFSTTSASEEWCYASEAVIRGLGRAGGGRFFVDRPDPLASNSILAGPPSSAPLPEKKKEEEEARPSSALVEESVAVAVESADPYGDFRASMEEMVSAHGLRGWADLQELLTWYLRVNAKRNHALIVAVFLDLLVALAAAAADAPTTTTTTMMTTTSSGSTSGSGSTSASSSTCGCAGDGGTSATEEQCCGGRGDGAERSSSGASEGAVGDEAGDGGYCSRVVDS
ncbi:transcription repressor OFP13 [Brachypodium distachyon]|uniref:Transcription repressor n=1 Tax=Brachypodium distachyon TaxID=15368 RepID=A0A2K2D1C1_BRADI|nr:transcription repressor OFP13 [Brachypodium distachyon]PNT68068.1 hypothetical protein BRADI_3g35441v3 [Brachypodium distachyon]|eukprot:XP_003572176.1 transcription repressor OFP13 [Brachypodium distachyon]